ncbi:MAG: hypothetical protein ACPGWR_24540 [Ardenticatenaceae bacterium]
MPTFRKLTAEELESFRAPVTGERARIRAEYRGYLEDITGGEGGELKLHESEKKVTIKNRLKRAAEEIDIKIEFKRSSADSVRFRVVGADEEE